MQKRLYAYTISLCGTSIAPFSYAPHLKVHGWTDCSKEETHGKGWFEGYDYMAGYRPKEQVNAR